MRSESFKERPVGFTRSVSPKPKDGPKEIQLTDGGLRLEVPESLCSLPKDCSTVNDR
jgi:hypothetical protein